MHNKRYIKNFQHYIVPLEEKENSPAGFFPRGVFPPQNKMGEKPCEVFYPKIIVSVFSSKKHFTLCVQVVRVLYQNREISISPLVRNPKIYVTKMAMYHC